MCDLHPLNKTEPRTHILIETGIEIKPFVANTSGQTSSTMQLGASENESLAEGRSWVVEELGREGEGTEREGTVQRQLHSFPWGKNTSPLNIH